MRVGYLGPPGTYSHEVAGTYFSPQEGVELVAYDTIEEVIAAADSKQVGVATVPIDNSLEGPVLVTLDHLSKIANIQLQNGTHQPSLQIIGEHYHLVAHCLITKKEATLENVTNVYSHAQALGQCRWILLILSMVSS
jgi:prephenate dehydratase